MNSSNVFSVVFFILLVLHLTACEQAGHEATEGEQQAPAPTPPLPPSPQPDYILQIFNNTKLNNETQERERGGPSIRAKAALGLTRDGNSVVVIGGGTNTPSGDNWRFDLTTKTWSNLPVFFNRTGACSAHAVAPLNVLWIFGGKQNGYVTDSLVAYFIDSGLAAITPSSPFGIPTQAVSCTSVQSNTRFFIFGGNNCSNVVYIYDFILRAWSVIHPKGNKNQLQQQQQNNNNKQQEGLGEGEGEEDEDGGPIPPGRVGASAVNYLNQEVIIFGGGCSNTIFSDVWRFDLTSETWSQDPVSGKGITPPEVMYHSAAIVGDEMIIIYGVSPVNTFGSNNVYAYNLNDYSWRQVLLPQTNMPPRQQQSIVQWNNRVFIFGGEYTTPDPSFYGDLAQFVVEKHCYVRDCENCTSTPGCGWCQSNREPLRSCVAGDANSPFIGSTCPNPTNTYIINAESCPRISFPEWMVPVLIVFIPVIIATVIMIVMNYRQVHHAYEEING